MNTGLDGRSRILEASIKIFAEKSFEGSRIEDIAKEAGVPKSLIYYHFKNKNEILELLTKRFIDDFSKLLAVAKDDTQQEKAEKLPERMKDYYVQFERQNADLIRVMFLESLKKTQEVPILFKVVQALIAAEKEFRVSRGEKYNFQQELAAEFFTRMIPNYAYICFAEAWSDYFAIEKEKLDEMFVKLIADTHGAYHRKEQHEPDSGRTE